MQPEILIVGAGPTGLMLALQLAQRGVEPRIVDKHASPLELTKAAAIHARALELLRDVGAADRVVEEGHEVQVLDLRTRYRDRIRVDFTTLDDTRFPFMIDLPQYRTELVLIDRLEAMGVTVEREVEMVDLRQDDDTVHVRLRHGDDRVEDASFAWAAGCDGASSPTRDLVGQAFHGDTYAEPWVLCDATLDWPIPRNEMTFSSDEQGIVGVFPLPGDRRYRLAYTQHVDANGQPVEPTLEDAQTALTRSGLRGTIHDTTAFWTFDLDHRQVDDFRVGRVLLVGDAAHVHTPFGGQGMNLGLGDAVNLGWKLAAAVNGTAPDGLLDTYASERHAIGREVVQRTHVGASAMLVRDGLLAGVRDTVMGAIGSTDTAMRYAARWLSQLAHTYRDHDLRPRLRAGDRLPDTPFYDASSNEHRRLHDVADLERMTLLVHVGNDARAARRLVAEGGLVPPELADHVTVVAVASDVDAMAGSDELLVDREDRLAALRGDGPRVHVVRPDRHLAAVDVVAEPDAVARALRPWLAVAA